MKAIHAVYFSAVGNTRTVVTEIAAAVRNSLCRDAGYFEIAKDDFTLPSAREHVRSFGPDELVVFGVPTYAGRVPNKVLPFVQELFRGHNTPVIPVVTFGNRSFDSSLAELCEVLKENGFLPFAAAAVACRHVFSDTLGAGRPDEKDLKEICLFAERAADVLLRQGAAAPENETNIKVMEDLPFPDLGEHGTVGPYYTPLGTDGQPAKFLKAKPKTDLSLCARCGLCARVCPMGSVDPEDITNVPGICIKCQACIRKCPKGAKYFDDPAFLSHKAMLEQNYLRRAQSFFAVPGQ